jgi:hypothetical protein
MNNSAIVEGDELFGLLSISTRDNASLIVNSDIELTDGTVAEYNYEF